jgi:hypothetical protein
MGGELERVTEPMWGQAVRQSKDRVTVATGDRRLPGCLPSSRFTHIVAVLHAFVCVCLCVSVCAVLGFELRAFTLSHSTSPFL